MPQRSGLDRRTTPDRRGVDWKAKYEASEYKRRHDCIIEIAVDNQSVSEYIKHWEGRALKAEARYDALLAVARELAKIIARCDSIMDCANLPMPSGTLEALAKFAALEGK